MAAPIPENEEARLAALESCSILDTQAEQDYDDITKVASCLCGSPIAVVSLVDKERQWFKSCVGLDVNETPRAHAFCAHAILDPGEMLVVKDATRDDRFVDNPLVTNNPNIRFYAGAPLVTEGGHALGTLCVIDRKPRELTPVQAEGLQALSRLVASQLEMRRSIAALEQKILDQEDYLAHVEDYQRRMEESNAKLQVLTMMDALTGVLNRGGFQKRLDEEFSRAKRHDSPLALMLLDVDHFKGFNDAFGHPAGDKVLTRVAALVQECVRDYDAVARYGGEEFAVLLPNTRREGAAVLAERIRRAIHRNAWEHRSVTVSLGSASLEPGISCSAELLVAADTALYKAKETGRNRCVHAFSSSEVAAAASNDSRIEEAIRQKRKA